MIKEKLRAFQESVKPFNKYSQNGEDGIIQDIFNRIGTANKWVMECGAADGVFFSNSRKLIEEGWQAVLVEADAGLYRKLCDRYAGDGSVESRLQGDGFHHTTPQFALWNCLAMPEGETSLDEILTASYAPTDIDLAVIDVDGQDYWLWNSMLAYRPRAVIVEFDPNADANFIPEIAGNGQAGRDAIVQLGVGKLYYPVAQTYCNLVFVRQDLLCLLTEDGEQISAREVTDQRQMKIAAAMSTPRVGFLSTVDCIYTALAPFSVPLARGEGAYWHHSLSRSIQSGLDKGAEYILTIDYDTLFTTQDLATLVCLLNDNPSVDVVVAMQQKREGGELLATSNGPVTLTDALVPITQGHFGLTLFRASVFTNIEKPWFPEKPNDSGDWGENRTDADIGFWVNCRENDIKVMMATDVVVGHLELVATWPDAGLKPYYQPVNDWRQSGQVKPAAAFDRAKLALAFPAALAMKG